MIVNLAVSIFPDLKGTLKNTKLFIFAHFFQFLFKLKFAYTFFKL